MKTVYIKDPSWGVGLKLFNLFIISRGKKKVHDYYQKLIDDFKLIVVNPSPKLTDQEKRSIANSFGYSSKDKSIENNL